MNSAAAAFRTCEEFVFIGKISVLEAHCRLQKVCSDVFVPIIQTAPVASFKCGFNDGAWAEPVIETERPPPFVESARRFVRLINSVVASDQLELIDDRQFNFVGAISKLRVASGTPVIEFQRAEAE